MGSPFRVPWGLRRGQRRLPLSCTHSPSFIQCQLCGCQAGAGLHVAEGGFGPFCGVGGACCLSCSRITFLVSHMVSVGLWVGGPL